MAHVREVPSKGGIAYEVRWRDGARERQRTFTAKPGVQATAEQMKALRDKATKFAGGVEADLRKGSSAEPLVRRAKTVGQVMEASYAASIPRLKPSMAVGSRSIYDRRVLPRFRRQRTTTVTSEAVEAWIAELVGKGLIGTMSPSPS